MAVSVTSRPSTWSAVKNPVVYKFETTGGPFTNYRIEIEVFNADDDSSLTGGVKFSFSPGLDGVTYADISAILRSHLSPDWAKPSALNEAEDGTSIGYYIKYQELYDGSSESVQNDNGNPRFAVFGGIQIPSAVGNNLTDYVPEYIPNETPTKRFLSKFLKHKMWRGFTQTLSFIYPNTSSSRTFLHKAQFNVSGDRIGESFDDLDLDDRGKVLRTNLSNGLLDDTKELSVQMIQTGPAAEILENTEFNTSLDPWFNDPLSSGEDWVHDTDRAVVSFTNPHDGSKNLRQNFSSGLFLNGLYKLEIVVGVSSGPVTVGLKITVRFSGTSFIVFGKNELIDFPSTTAITKTYFFRHEIGAANTIELYASDPTGSAPFDVRILRASLARVNPDEWTKEEVFDVVEPCRNPVMLFWKNSLGGDSWWLFEHDQEVSYTLSDAKARRMVLRAGNLTADQWEALNELNHIGQVYKQNVREFTSSVNKSHVRDGTQVYVVDEDGNKTGVVVIPRSSVMFTRARRHEFEIEIEFPERYE